MTKNLFSVPIFFIVFRETLEAAIIVSVLLGLAQQIVRDDPNRLSQTTADSSNEKQQQQSSPPSEDAELLRRRLIRKLRFQVLQPFIWKGRCCLPHRFLA
jgi:high-affinity iron transporter